MVSGEEDFSRRMIGQVDHRKILGVALKTPSVAQSIPSSIENSAIAYDAVNDRFKVDIEAITLGTLDVDISDEWTRELGQIDIARVLGSALAHSNPLIVRISDGTTWLDPRAISDNWARELGQVDIARYLGSTVGLANAIHTAIVVSGAVIDPRDRTWTITENLARSWNLGASDVPDLSDRAARLLGIVYGNQDQLQQRATTKELYVQISHQGAEKDPTQIRALTSSDEVTVADVTKTATEVQISNTFASAGNYTVHTPTGTNKVRLKLISLELSDDQDLSFRWTTSGTQYYLRTTAGVIVTNFIGCNPEGGASEALVLYAGGACTVKGYCLLEEIA